MADNVVKFEDVQKFTSNENETIIDVREPKELKETGVIPNSINIPVGTIEEIFKNMPDKDFKTKYGRSKPKKDDPITVSCKMGGRSAKAQDLLKGLGYSNIKNYSGGWLDWEKHINEKTK